MVIPLPQPLRSTLAAYAATLQQRFGARLRCVRLFGSWARGDAHEDSDVDVAVVVEGLTRQEWADAIGDAVDAELTHGVTLSPYVVSGAHLDLLRARELPLGRAILEEGVAL